MRLATTLVASLLCLLPASGQAQNERWTNQVRDLLARRADWYQERGYTATDVVETGSLRDDEAESTRISLDGGTEYAIIAVCDQDCTDVDLTIYDPSDQEVAKDVETDDIPVVMFQAPSTGRYRLKVGMAACSESPCFYGFRVYRRTGRPSEAAARSDRKQFEDQVTTALRGRADYYSGQGYRQRGENVTGTLKDNESESHYIELSSLYSYAIVGACDNDCRDIDLTLYDDGGNEVNKDVAEDRIPLLFVSPASTGRYRVKVTMANCTNEPCYYGFAVHVK